MAAYTEFAVLGGPSEEGDAADEGDAAENGFSLVIDEAITEVDDSGAAFTAFGFLATWRGQQSAGYRRFKEFRTLHTQLDAGVIESRAQGLQQYLKDALREALARGSLPLPLSEFLRLPAEEEEEEEDEGEAVPVTGAGAAGASRFGALLGVLGGGPLPAQQAAAQQAAAEGDSADLEGGCGAGGSQRSSSLLLDLDEEGCAEEPPALLGVGVGGSSSSFARAADNEAALATLQRMRRHLSTLRSLQPRLVRAVAAATPEATSPGGSEAARPYEALESPCQQVKRLDAPLAQVDSLLEALRLQLGGDDALDEELRAHEREREKRLSKLRTATGQQARAAAAGGGGSATFNASGSDGEAGGRATGVLRSWLGRGRA